MSRHGQIAVSLLLVLQVFVIAEAAVPAGERGALVDLYNQTGGANWNDSTGWLEAPGTECTWYGITCDETETAVVGLSFNTNNLDGAIPSSLSNLTSLRYADFSDNALTGTIPASLGTLANLEELALSNNQLTGSIPSSLGSLTQLTYLALNTNQLTGTIPPSLGSLGNLEQLLLYDNQLTGPIPSELGQLANATYIAFGYNQLTGSIPSSLGGLVSVDIFDLAANQLTGPIPSSLGNLSNVTYFDLAQNQLTGEIPGSFAALSNLQKLVLDGNQLDGTVPSWLGDLSNLEEIFLANNALTGSLPPELGSLPNLRTLILESNQLTGSIPAALGSLDNLETLALGYNQLDGAIPPELATLPRLVYLSLYSNRLTGTIPSALGGVSTLVELGLGGNMLSGTIPTELGGLASLDTLSLENNELTGTIPAVLGNLSNLTYLDLAGNQLTGTIPDTLANLTKLWGFLVYNNRLTGAVPTWLASLTDLRELLVGGNQLTGTIPGNITSLTNLTYLDTCGNYLTGSIPSDIGNLQNLEYLELCSNDLSGAIPEGLWTLTNLIDVRLEDNQFSGTLPPEVGNLTNAELLLLGYNQLEGAIPDEIAGLQSMNVLELDGNRFTGAIPSSIGTMTTLEFLGLSDNALGGEIPISLANLVNLEDGQGLRIGYNALTTSSSSLAAFLDSKHDPEDPWESTQTVAPTGLSISDVTDRSFVVHLTPIEYIYDEGGYEITVTSVVQIPDGSQVVVATTASKEATSIIVRGLDPETTYGVVARTVTHPHGFQQNLVRSEASSSVDVTTGPKVVAPASVDVTVPPGGLVEIGGAPQGDTSYTLTNFGDVATTITLDQTEAFFTQSPTTFSLGAGASQVVTVSAVPNQPPDSYWGAAVPTGVGVPEDLYVTIQMLSVAAPSGTVLAVPLTSRVDVSGAPGADTIGTVSFRNTGTATLVGILVSDVEWIETPVDLVEIPPDEIRNVNFTVRRSKRPDAGLADGALSTTLRLVYLDGSGAASIAGLHASATPVGVTQTLVTVVDTAKPAVGSGTIPSPGSGEVLRIVPGVVGSSSRVSDLVITNAFGAGSISDLQVFFREAGSSTAKVAPLSGLAPSQSLALSSVVGSVFGSASTGSLFVRTASSNAIRVAAGLVDVSNAEGSYGAALPVFRSDRAAAAGGEIDLAGVDASFAPAIVIQEMTGAPADVTLDAFDASGSMIGDSIDVGSLGAFGSATTSSLPGGTRSVIVRNDEESSGAIAAYARMEDATSGDLWTIGDWRRMNGLGAVESMRVPLVMREAEPSARRRPVRRPGGSGGGSSTSAAESFEPLRTSLALFNPTESAIRVTLVYRGSGSERERAMTVGARETATLDDVAATMLGRAGFARGSLEIAAEGAISASARLSGAGEGGGTRGAGIPLVSSTAGMRLGQSRIFSGLDDVRETTFDARVAGTSRTSFGFAETAGSAVTVRVSVFVFSGAALAGTRVSRDIDLQPWETMIFDGMLRSIVGASRETLFGDLRNLQLEVQVVEGDGSVVPFVIATDSGSGDLRFRLE